jgi:pimeloyl-ACP methyl ester carboxylesterase
MRAVVVLGLLGVLALAGCDKPRTEPKADSVSKERIAGPAGSLHVDDGGAGGLPVVFAHSYAGSAAHWSAELAHLRTQRRAVAFDFRAHGRSTPSSTGDYSVDALAQDIGAVVDGLGIDRFVLVGHSQGASAALAYAAKQPQRVAGLVLVGVPGRIPKEQAQKIIASIEADYDNVMRAYWDKLMTGARSDVRARIEREMKSVPKDVSIALIKALFDDDPLAALRRYPGPKLIVATSHNDQPTDLVQLAPDVPNRTLAGTSHWPHLDKPDEFDRLLDDFLGGIR